MKRFWHTCLAMVATATVSVSVANAQNNWNAPSEIGSYQSILSRAGYGQDNVVATAGRALQGSGTSNLPTGSGTINGGGGPAIGGGGSSTVGGGLPSGSGTVNAGSAWSDYSGSSTVNNAPVAPQAATGQAFAPTGGSCPTCVGNAPNFNAPNFGGHVHGGQVVGGSAIGGQIVGGQAIGSPIIGTPVVSGPIVNGPVVNGPIVGGATGFIDNNFSGFNVGSNAYSGVVNNVVGPGYDPGYHPPIYSAPFQVSQVSGQAFQGASRAKNANWVVGLYAASFARDYEDDRRLSRNSNGNVLTTRSADEGDFGGYGVSLTRRGSNGRGIELRYWAFNPDDSVQINGPGLEPILPNLQQLQHVPTGRDLNDIFYSANNHLLIRNTDINNFEVNLLNNGGHYYTRRGRAANFELLGGFRWFQFDEQLAFISNNDPAQPPAQTLYETQAENDLVGFQLGARNEICLGRRLSAFSSISTGIFNNHIKTRQRFFDQNGSFPVLTSGPSAGQEFNFGDSKDDVAFLGEIDLGLTYQVSQRLRARFGYRAFGIAGVALAGDQIPFDFSNTNRIQSANSNGSFLLHGGYVGLEACF